MTGSILTATESATAQYAILTARELFVSLHSKYARVFEDLQVDDESCRRDVRVMWRLPTLAHFGLAADALPSDRSLPLVIPITIMRRGQMYSDFRVSGDVPIRILSHRRSVKLTTALVRMEWERLTILLLPLVGPNTVRTLTVSAETLIPRMVESDARSARRAIKTLVEEVERVLRNLQSVIAGTTVRDEFQRFLINCAQRIGRRHIIWGEISARPGDVISFGYGYETRFALGYSSAKDSQRLPRRAYESWKRWVGQPPSIWIIPISRHALAESYHVTLQAPPERFLDRFTFIDRSAKRRRSQSFENAVASVGGKINGRDESGGSLGHLHLYGMQQRNDVSPAVLGHVMEKQPGATASVAWLATLTLLASSVVAVRWDQLFNRGDITTSTSIALALPGAVALWFAHVLDSQARRRLTTAARLGLYTALYATSAILALVLLASLGVGLGSTKVRVSFVAVVVSPQILTAGYAWLQRIRFQRRFHSHQLRVSQKYGL